MNAEAQRDTSVNTPLWIIIVIFICVLTYLLGFVVSHKTGVEPGFFEQPEAGGYGASTEKSTTPGLDSDLHDYYKDLNE